MCDMKVGDKAFFYHSNCKKPGIAGIVEVSNPWTRMIIKLSILNGKNEKGILWYVTKSSLLAKFTCHSTIFKVFDEQRNHLQKVYVNIFNNFETFNSKFLPKLM